MKDHSNSLEFFGHLSTSSRKFANNFIGLYISEHVFFLPQGGCISKLEEFILQHLLILGAVGVGIAFLQVRKNPQHLFQINMCFCQFSYTVFEFFVYYLFLLSFVDFRNALYLLSVSKFKRRALLRPCILYSNTKTKNTHMVLTHFTFAFIFF